jgi:hypothetical protein
MEPGPRQASRKNKPDHEKSPGAAPAAGASFNPSEGSDKGPSEAGSAPRSVTHGLPIPESEYRKLKKVDDKAHLTLGRPLGGPYVP